MGGRAPALPFLATALFALLVAAAIAAPFALAKFHIHLLALIIAYGVWAMSFGLVMGQVGLTSFGHASVFGIGSYAAAWLGLNVTESLPAALLAGAVAGGVLGAVMGIVLGRLGGVAFAIGSLAFGGMISQIANSWIDVTGGSDGLVGLPYPRLGPWTLDDSGLYWSALALALATTALLRLGLAGSIGVTLHAVRDNPARALASGISVYRVRWLTLGVSGMIAGAAGALAVYAIGSVAPSAVNWTASGDVLVMAVLGGVRTLGGPFIGAAAYTILEQALSQFVPNYRLVLGLFFVAIVVAMPGGLHAGLAALRSRLGYGHARL